MKKNQKRRGKIHIEIIPEYWEINNRIEAVKKTPTKIHEKKWRSWENYESSERVDDLVY